MLRTVLKVTAATLAFCAVHSLLASPQAKQAAQRAVKPPHGQSLYRVFYMAQSAATLTALIVYICSLPNQTLYRASGKWKWLMRAGQALSLLAQLHTAVQIGIGNMTGARGLWRWLGDGNEDGGDAAHPEIVLEAQGPTQENGALRTTGMFRLSRHPLNLLALPLLWLQTPMTTRWASFSAAASLYFYFGSFLEAARLRARYGRAYMDYERSGVPFFFPRRRPYP